LENPATYTGTLVAEYFTVDALEIGAESPTQGLQTIEVKSPVPNQEIIISGGLAIGELAQTSLSLPSVLGPIKKGYQVICDGSGSLALCPQPILASVKVVDLVGTTRTVNQATLSGSAVYLTLGLTRAIERTILNPTTSYDLNLKIQIVGVDGNGTSRVETITFLGSQWKDQVPTVNEEQPLQFLRTYYKYQLINSIALANTLSEPHNAGPDAAISMWADALSGVDNQEFASVASFFWTGSTGIRVKDERLIATSFDKLDQKKSRFPTELPDANFSTVQELYSVILNPPLTNPATPAKRLMLELDDDRVWADTWKEFSTAWASGAITVADVTFITMGQTIRIAQNKYLRVVQSGANPSLGEVNYSTSGDIFRNNIIVTINDPTWDSSWYASLGQGTNPPISLTRELAYPEGFAVNTRLRIIFSSPFTAGSFQLTINSVVIGPVAFDTDNVTTLNKIKTEINNAATLTGGVTAVVEGTTGLILNGHPDGHPFECLQSDFVSSGGAPAASTQPPLTAFTVTQPSNGILPTAHLPQRYPSSLTTWEYLSRPFLWEGVWLEGTIAVSGDNPALIGDFDAIEIAPSKVIFARVGSGATADPTIGQYLVDAGSIGNTLANLAATVNHPLFASGVSASVVGTTVVLRSSGMASTTLRILASVVPNTWILSSVGGNTQYVPTGAGSGYGLIKALKPLEAADWRYVTVEEVAAGWTLWMPLISLSQTSYLFEAPAGKSFYQIQFRLRGGISNSFALYSYVPETSSATLTAIDSRLTAVEDIIDDADGNCSSLAVRLSNIVDLDGVPIQDTELTNARASVILPTQAVLKDRLDIMDTRLYFTSAGGVTPHGVVTEAHAGLPPQLIAGPLDINGNSNFINAVGLTVYAGGSISDPLLTQINGFTYRYERQIPFTFVGGGTPSPAVGNYYVYLTESTAWGYELTDGTCDLAEGDTSIVDLAANFVADEVEIGHLVVFPTLTLGGEPLVFSIVGVFATSVTISGTVPLNASMVTYKVYNPKEGIIQIHSGSKVISTDRLYLGEINWTGSAVNVLSYRYLNSYSSPVVRVDASTGSYETSFAHNLGFYPKSFTIYFWEEVAGIPSGDPKVLHLGDEAVVKTTKYSMTVKNRASYLVARTYGGIVKDVGYLQLVI
jgi:hypothetical protein